MKHVPKLFFSFLYHTERGEDADPGRERKRGRSEETQAGRGCGYVERKAGQPNC